jgi:hypothetical protein
MAGPAPGLDDADGDAQDPAAEVHARFADGKQIAVGPLLNYRRMEGKTWVGSVLVVTKGGGKEQPFIPTLTLHRVSSFTGNDPGQHEQNVVNGNNGLSAPQEGGSSSNAGSDVDSQSETVRGLCLYSDARNTFWRFTVEVQLEDKPTIWEYSVADMRFTSHTKPQQNRFHLPAFSESMRILFHSCNGFSVGTDEAAFSGPALWNDVLRKHAERPFNVMIGGGDQIYNDGIRVNGPLRPWTDISNPKKRRDYPFPEKLRQDCDDYYLKNYLRWYGTEPFATANGQIPQLNIWDDHDIIDGFGSYVDDFMKCSVFRGIGGTAHKYYMLFQHHMPPPLETFTTDAAQPGKVAEGQGLDPVQREKAYTHAQMTESNYIVGPKPGVLFCSCSLLSWSTVADFLRQPWVAEHSHSMYARLGARMAFVGLDARTEVSPEQARAVTLCGANGNAANATPSELPRDVRLGLLAPETRAVASTRADQALDRAIRHSYCISGKVASHASQRKFAVRILC